MVILLSEINEITQSWYLNIAAEIQKEAWKENN